MIKTALAPTATREEAWEYIGCKVTECEKGISDSEAECLGLAETWDFDKAKIVERFRQARDVHEAKRQPKPEQSLKERFNAAMLRLVPDAGALSQSRPEARVSLALEARAPAMATGAGPKLELPLASASAPAAVPRPGVVVDVDAPFEVARRFLNEHYQVGNVLTLRWWRGEWRKWIGTHYAVMEGDELRSEIYTFLSSVNHGKFDPAPKHVNEAVDGIKAWTHLKAEAEVGTWLGDGEPPWDKEATICCKNGVVRLCDGKVWPHDPRLFSVNVIETEYRPGAEAPRWATFLDELWDADVESRNALQEFFGLVLTDETKFQKGFILVGPARSGKGTISRTLMRLLGHKNFSGPSLGQLSQQFGMENLIGKKVAVVPDARLDGRANRSVITEKLLSIIGEDIQDINRKNKTYWSGILRLRVMILSNELPDFKDDTGVIATRFVILQTHKSFLGKEDPELENKLAGELSGILNWAIEGWQRLAQRGRFKPPGNGELNEELSSIASSVKAFANECLEFGEEYTVVISTAYDAYKQWCQRQDIGYADRLRNNQFSMKLRSAFPGTITDWRPRTGGTRQRHWKGVRLRTVKRSWSA
jgi:putative DNA primase/helicase